MHPDCELLFKDLETFPVKLSSNNRVIGRHKVGLSKSKSKRETGRSHVPSSSDLIPVSPPHHLPQLLPRLLPAGAEVHAGAAGPDGRGGRARDAALQGGEQGGAAPVDPGRLWARPQQELERIRKVDTGQLGSVDILNLRDIWESEIDVEI